MNLHTEFCVPEISMNVPLLVNMINYLVNNAFRYFYISGHMKMYSYSLSQQYTLFSDYQRKQSRTKFGPVCTVKKQTQTSTSQNCNLLYIHFELIKV